MGILTGSTVAASPRESVMVVLDASRSKGSVDALDWALKHVVRPKDTVVVLGILFELGKKNNYFPFHMGIGISGIWEILEFSGQGKLNRRELEEEIKEKKEQYQSSLQPFYRQCNRNEVKLEVKLAAGFCPGMITIDEAQNYNTRWIVIDSHLKLFKTVIYGHVGCNIAVMKGKDIASLMPSKAGQRENSSGNSKKIDAADFTTNQLEELQNEGCLIAHQKGEPSTSAPPQSPCLYPLSWRTGFPRAFTQSELAVITNGFAEENMVYDQDDAKVYHGMFEETPILVRCFMGNDERFWSVLKILSRVRHRNILNIVGYCCTGASMFLLLDFPCMGNLEYNLQSFHLLEYGVSWALEKKICRLKKGDDLAMKLPWKARWYIAQEIGGCLRYLHEECVDGPIVHLSVSSSHVLISHSRSAMLGNFISAKWPVDDVPCNEDSPTECLHQEEDERTYNDIHDYGVLLLELITGQSIHLFEAKGDGHSLIDSALPLLENGFLSQVKDPRLTDNGDTRVVNHMAHAACLCLKNHLGRRISMSEVLAVVRGDQLAPHK